MSEVPCVTCNTLAICLLDGCFNARKGPQEVVEVTMPREVPAFVLMVVDARDVQEMLETLYALNAIPKDVYAVWMDRVRKALSGEDKEKPPDPRAEGR
jgi:hypothetical protein